MGVLGGSLNFALKVYVENAYVIFGPLLKDSWGHSKRYFLRFQKTLIVTSKLYGALPSYSKLLPF